jgi:hypothetical protein
MKTVTQEKITAILEIFDGIALCQIGSELRHVHTSKIVGLK